MATRTSKEPSGEILLKDSWYESASGHVEVSQTQYLRIVGNKIVLNESFEELKFLPKHRRDKSELSYKLPINEVISFIKERGKKDAS